MDELKPSEKFVDSLMVQTGFHHYEVDRPLVLVAGTPSVANTHIPPRNVNAMPIYFERALATHNGFSIISLSQSDADAHQDRGIRLENRLLETVP
jgi:hypothetical protein